MDTHVNVVVRTKRDHFSKYAPKRSNHANFQLLKIKNKKVMTKKPLIVEKSNPLMMMTQATQLVVGDVDDVFLPTPCDLLANLANCRPQITQVRDIFDIFF